MKFRLLLFILCLCSLLPSVVSAAGPFVNNGNGTMTDTGTGLVWLKNANCTETAGGVAKLNRYLKWYNAQTWSNGLHSGLCDLSDGSQAGDWRLPTMDELDSLIRGGVAPQMMCSGDLCATYNPNGTYPYLWLMSHGFTAVQDYHYWSSSTYPGDAGRAWLVDMAYGGMSNGDKRYFASNVWPVRGVQLRDSVISGTVSDAATGASLAGAGVSINSQNYQTDTIGKYTSISLVPAQYDVSASKTGYETQSKFAPTISGQTTLINFNLKPMYQVKATFTGNGGGEVTSTPTGIACGTTCSADFVWNTPLTLKASPFEYSLFTGWTDLVCLGTTPDCAFFVLAPASVTANFDFDSAHSVQADGPPLTYYPSLQKSFDDVASGIIRAWSVTFNENLSHNRPVNITLLGGQNEGYSAQTGTTTIKGNLNISKGSLTVDRVIVK
jgi:hypothetical protein